LNIQVDSMVSYMILSFSNLSIERPPISLAYYQHSRVLLLYAGTLVTALSGACNFIFKDYVLD
jgi:hypothetical protein